MKLRPAIAFRRTAVMSASLGSLLSAAASAEPVSFNRDIRPIMSDTCFHCHGFDPKTREAGLRLDVREDALKPTEDGVVGIVPGKPGESAIIQRIFDEDDPMPPDKAHKPLTAEQKELMRRWVAEGALYEPHWAYAPLKRPALPAGTPEGKPAIDAFIQASLAAKNLTPSAEAPPHTLLRRLSLDLTGLPPTPAEEAAFEQSHAKDPETSIQDLVSRLLASPHFGERMAVWWLDIARFADTVGFHGDQNQRIFPYRDYVINAFNTNKRFDAFTREQLAGDLLPDPTPEQLVATGYNRLNMMTREGGAQPREYLAKYGAERVRSVAAAWFGSTFGCAECHDHKFDPIKTRDFYELQSFFADVKQWGVYADYGYTPEPELKGINNDSPFPPEIQVESPVLKQRMQHAQEELRQHLAATLARLRANPQSLAAQGAWEKKITPFLRKHTDGWLDGTPVKAVTLRNGKPQPKRLAALSPDHVIQRAKDPSKGEETQVICDLAGLPAVAAVRVQIDTEATDAKALAAQLGKSLTLSLQLQPAKGGKARRISLRAGEATAKRPVHRNGEEVPGLQNEWRLPAAHAQGAALHAVWLLETPLTISPGDKMLVSLGGDSTAPMRVAFSPLGALQPLEAASPASLKGAPALETFLLSTAHDRAGYDQAQKLAATVRSFHGGRAWSLVTQAVPRPLPVRVLPRGNWQDETGPLVLPSTPSFLPGRIESTAEKRLTRLDLANWIVSAENPITARAVMNRLWALFFGNGLSGKVDDLGSQGELPSHPELLDWLASEFRGSGWDMQHMIRLMVTSHTYRQSSSLRPEALKVDPANRLLASQNPRRLEAEFVRDNALAVAGLLNTTEIGGPSVKPYQPAGYYEALQFPNRDYLPDTDAQQWRRGVYMHWQRTFLHPMLANFDAPARDECAAARTTSNTPQQALTLLNDPTFVEAARVFAARLLTNADAADDTARLQLAFALALNREPKAQEVKSLTQFLATQLAYFKEHTAEAEKAVSTGLAPKAAMPAAEHAAWTQLARVLLNTQEVLTRY